MTTSQPPSADMGPGPASGPSATPTLPGPVRPATLAGAVLALLTYLCGFFGASVLSFPMILVLAGGLLALIGLLPGVGRVLVTASVLTASGFFLLLLIATSPPGDSAGTVKWVALALALLSAAAVLTALLFEVGVLTAPAPRPARAPQPPPGWSPYGQGAYGGQAPPPGAAQGGLFEQGAYGQNYGAPGSYGYASPGQPGQSGQPGYGGGYPGPASAPGSPGYGSSVSGGYGAVGAGGYGSGGYGAPGYGGPPGQPAQSAYPGQGAGSFAPPPSSGGPDGQPSSGGPDGQPSSGTPGTDRPSGAQPANGGPTPASAPTLAPTPDTAPETTTPGVPASGGGDTLSDADDERTRSFRPDGPSGSGS